MEGDPTAFNAGVPGSTALCAKGLTGPQFVYAADRLEYPLKRAGAKGEGKFQRITWDEALDTIADKLKESKEKYGPEAYAVLSPEYWPVLGSLGRRFLNVHGSPNYLHSAICATPRMASARVTIGYYQHGARRLDEDQAHRQLGRQRGELGRQPGRAPGDAERPRTGAQMLDIRPMLDPMGAKADMWLPVRPGTDCALALAFLHVLIGERLYDAEFVGRVVLRLRQAGRACSRVLARMGGADHRLAGRADPRGCPAHRRHAPDVHPDGQRHRRPGQRRHGHHLGGLPDRGHHRQPRRARRAVRRRRFGAAPRWSPWLDEMLPSGMVERLVAPEAPIWYQAPGAGRAGPPPLTTRHS